MQQVITVSEDFNVAPAGRSTDDGPFSGEAFRNKILVPALRTGNVVIVNLDGTEGYGSSFLEEAFGGLVRTGLMTPHDLHHRLKFVSKEDPTLIQEIWSYIDTAKPMKAS